MTKNDIDTLEKEFQNEDDLIYQLRKKSLVPILKDGKLYIYKIIIDQEFSTLRKKYEANFYDSYKVLQLNDHEFNASFSEKMIDHHQPSVSELVEYLGLNDIATRKEFWEKNAQEVEVKVQIDKEMYAKCYRKEEPDEVFKRVAKSYLVCVLKRKSKLSAIMDLIENNHYFNLDFIASTMCQFFNLGTVNFSASTKDTLKENEAKIRSMSYSDKEKELWDKDKIAIVKEIYNSLNIMCIFSEEIDKISDFRMQLMENCETDNIKDVIINFATHNSDILENSAFSYIFINHNIKSRSRLRKK